MIPIAILLICITIVVWRLPKPRAEYVGQFAHLDMEGFRIRRALNWVAVGIAYALLYFARYNLNEGVRALGGQDMVVEFNTIFAAGTFLYGVSFLINGPLTDKLGGRFSILIGVAGAACANALMGVATWMFGNGWIGRADLFHALLILYPVNMYFQSFGAVAIVKINAPWFHVRERGVFGAVFGILISLGIYFGYDWSRGILKTLGLSVHWVFYVPAACLAIAFITNYLIVRNRPSEAKFKDFNTGDATANDANTKPDLPWVVIRRMLKDPIIITLALIEFCTGFLRQSVMQQYPMFAEFVGLKDAFVSKNWGLLLCCAGIIGGMAAGVFSDIFFRSKRAMSALILYGGLLIGAVIMLCVLESGSTDSIGWIAVFMSMCFIGVHGLLSGTATQDFGGTKNAGIVVGLVDGMVYLGTGLQSTIYANVLPVGEAAKEPKMWASWPIAAIPFAVIGVILCYRIRHAKPKNKA